MSLTFEVALRLLQPINEWIKHVTLAEELEYRGVWMPDTPLVYRECFSALTYAATQTDRVRLGTGVIIPIIRHPAVVASSIATIDEIADQRTVLGLGRGGSVPPTFGKKHLSLHDTERTVQVIRGLLGGETVPYEGADLSMSWEARDIPIYLAASGPKSLQLAGRIADGVMFQVGVLPEAIEYAVTQIQKGVEESGRSMGDIELCARLGCSVFPEESRARRAIRSKAATVTLTFAAIPDEIFSDDLRRQVDALHETYDFSHHGYSEATQSSGVTDDIYGATVIAGTPSQVTERWNRLHETLRELGIQTVVLNQPEQDPNESMRRFAGEVRPNLTFTA